MLDADTRPTVATQTTLRPGSIQGASSGAKRCIDVKGSIDTAANHDSGKQFAIQVPHVAVYAAMMSSASLGGERSIFQTEASNSTCNF